jgi:hypothetical protein
MHAPSAILRSVTNKSRALHVELVYNDDCPNVALARTNLVGAFSLAGIPPKWSEHRIGDPNAPVHTRGYGSPTVLVLGADVAGIRPGAEDCCRIYAGVGQASKAPSVELIAAALSRFVSAQAHRVDSDC